MKKVTPLLLVLILLISSCGDNETPWLGDYSYTAPIVWLEPIITEEAELLEYRQVLNLDEFVTHTSLPVVVCVRQSNDPTGSIVIPQMEEWAYNYRDEALFVFADATVSDPLVNRFEFSATPTFFLVEYGTSQMQVSWETEETLTVFEDALIERLG